MDVCMSYMSIGVQKRVSIHEDALTSPFEMLPDSDFRSLRAFRFMCMPYLYVLYVCLICMPYMYALLYVCFVCMPCMYALYVCLICMPHMLSRILARSGASIQNTFYTEHILYRAHSTQNTFYTDHILHRPHFIQNTFYTDHIILYRPHSIQNTFYTQTHSIHLYAGI